MGSDSNSLHGYMRVYGPTIDSAFWETMLVIEAGWRLALLQHHFSIDVRRWKKVWKAQISRPWADQGRANAASKYTEAFPPASPELWVRPLPHVLQILDPPLQVCMSRLTFFLPCSVPVLQTRLHYLPTRLPANNTFSLNHLYRTTSRQFDSISWWQVGNLSL